MRKNWLCTTANYAASLLWLLAILVVRADGPWFIPTTNRVGFLPAPDGKVVFVSNESGRIDRWSRDSQTFLTPLIQPPGARGMDLSPDGRYLVVPGVIASPNSDNEAGVTFWENPSVSEPVRQEVRWKATIAGEMDLNRVTFAPDGTVFLCRGFPPGPIRRVSLKNSVLLETGLPSDTVLERAALIRNSYATAAVLMSSAGVFSWNQDGRVLTRVSTNSLPYFEFLLSNDGTRTFYLEPHVGFFSTPISNPGPGSLIPNIYLGSFPAMDARRPWIWEARVSGMPANGPLQLTLIARDFDGLQQQTLSFPTNLPRVGLNSRGVGAIEPAYDRRSIWAGTVNGIVGFSLPLSQPFALLSAHDFGRTNQVLLRFNNRLNPFTAALTENYQVDPPAVISNVRVKDAEGHVELDLSAPVETVTVSNVTDESDRPMESPVRVPVSHRPVRPDDHGTVVMGYQDSFSGKSLNSDWVSRGFSLAVDNTRILIHPYTLVDGAIRLGSGARGDGPQHLLYERPGYSSTHQEVLVRVRILQKHLSGRGDRLAGATAGVALRRQPFLPNSPPDYIGVNAALYSSYPFFDSRMAFGNDLDQGPPSVYFDYLEPDLGQWMWIRLRHRPNFAPDQPDVFSKLWIDDGKTPEPVEWYSFNYANRPEDVREGFAGIAGTLLAEPFGRIHAEREVDYILIKADGLPETEISADGFRSPDIESHPVSMIGLEGEYLTLSATAFGAGSLSYHWHYNGRQVPGMLTNRMTIGPVTQEQNGLYSVVVSNAYGSSTSSPARLTVYGRSLFASDGDGIYSDHWTGGTRSNLLSGRDFLVADPGGTLRLRLQATNSSEWKVASADIAVWGEWPGIDPAPEPGRWGVQSSSRGLLYQTSFCTIGTGSQLGATLQEYPSLLGGPVFDHRFGDELRANRDSRISIYRVRFLIPPGDGDEGIEFGVGATNMWSFWGINRFAVTSIPNSLGLVRFRDRSINIAENGSTLNVVLERLGNSQSTATFAIDVLPDAISKIDDLPNWARQRHRVQFSPGETNQILRLPIQDNSQTDPLKRLRLVVTEIEGAAAPGDVLECWVQILDDESGIKSIEVPKYVEESVGEFAFAATLFGHPISPDRYGVRPSILGEGFKLILRQAHPVIRVFDDNVVQPDRRLQLTVRDHFTAGPSHSAEVLVLDNDISGFPAQGPNSVVRSITAISEGRLLVTGGFDRWSGEPRPGAVILSASGKLRPEVPNWPGVVPSARPFLDFPNGDFLVRTTDAQESYIKIRGDLTMDSEFDSGALQFGTPRGVDSQNRFYVSRVNFTRTNTISTLRRHFANGKIDSGFAVVPFRGEVSSVAVETSGTLLVAGKFDQIHSQDQKGLCRLNSDGTFRSDYRPVLDSFFFSDVRLIALPDGRVIVWGFSEDKVVSADGSSTATFLPNETVKYGDYYETDFTNHRFYRVSGTKLMRFDRDGREMPFISGPVSINGSGFAVNEVENGSVLVGGFFTELSGQKVRNFARIDAEGRLAPWPGYEMPPRLKAPQTNVTVGAGRPLTLALSIPEGEWRYLWVHNGTPLNAQTNAVLWVPNTSLEHAGRYQLLLRGRNGLTESMPIDVRVIAKELAPIFVPFRSASTGIGYRFQVPKDRLYQVQQSSDLSTWSLVPVSIISRPNGDLELFPSTEVDYQYYRILLE